MFVFGSSEHAAGDISFLEFLEADSLAAGFFLAGQGTEVRWDDPVGIMVFPELPAGAS